mgnify:CR=1 FL=1
MRDTNIKNVIEAMIFASEEPLTLSRINNMLMDQCDMKLSELKDIVENLKADYSERGVELIETASGFSFKTREDYTESLRGLWDGRRPKYTRAFLETMAIIAYRQPVTRGDIEEIRGVAASSALVRQLLDRDWIRAVGRKEVPGRPTLYGTTNAFLDYFGLRSLNDLPVLEKDSKNDEEIGDFPNGEEVRYSSYED